MLLTTPTYRYLTYSLLCVSLALPVPSRADETKAQAQKALEDAQATNNPYVIDAVKQQLLKEHPEWKDWLSPGNDHTQAGRASIYNAPAPKEAPLPPTEEAHYAGEVQLGLVHDSGNTEGSSFNSKANITRDNKDWLFLGQASAAVDNDGHVTTKETYRALAQANYKLEPDERLMTTFFWTSDRFTGFRDRFEEVSGLSNDWQLPYKMKITTELAGGARQLELTDGENFNEPILWLRGNFSWPFADRWTFSEDVRDSIGTRYTFLWSDTSLTLQMDQGWKLRFAVENEYDNNPPLGRKALDTNTLINLVYGF